MALGHTHLSRLSLASLNGKPETQQSGGEIGARRRKKSRLSGSQITYHSVYQAAAGAEDLSARDAMVHTRK